MLSFVERFFRSHVKSVRIGIVFAIIVVAVLVFSSYLESKLVVLPRCLVIDYQNPMKLLGKIEINETSLTILLIPGPLLASTT